MWFSIKVIRLYIDLLAYILTEEVPPRDLDGPSANLALGDIISNVLPLDGKKDKLLGSDSNNVSDLIRKTKKNFFFDKSKTLNFGRYWTEAVKVANQLVHQV